MIADAPHDRRILIFVPARERGMSSKPIYSGWHTARWEDSAGQWIIGGEIYFDEAFHVDEEDPTHWQEVPEDPR